MKAAQPIVAGLAAAIVFAGLLMSHQSPQASAPSASRIVTASAPLASQELPQDQVKDMSYN